MVVNQLRNFYHVNNNIAPERIICFRDGVAHNMFEQVHKQGERP